MHDAAANIIGTRKDVRSPWTECRFFRVLKFFIDGR